MMLSGGGVFKRYLGYESRAFVDGINLLKQASEGSLVFSTMWGHSKKAPATNQEGGPYQKETMLALGLKTSQPLEL